MMDRKLKNFAKSRTLISNSEITKNGQKAIQGKVKIRVFYTENFKKYIIPTWVYVEKSKLENSEFLKRTIKVFENIKN